MPSHTGDLFAGQPLPPPEHKPQSRPRPGKDTQEKPATGPTSPGSASEAGGWDLTAHCDGGARGNPGPAGFGAEVRDAQGMVVAELSEFLGIATNNVAEYSGLLACLAYALEHGARSLSVVSDSELMVKQIQGRYKVNSPDLKPLWAECKRRIAKLARFEIRHALRHKNKAADRLANEAMDRGTKRPHAPGTPAPPPLQATPYPDPKRAAAAMAPSPVPIVRGGGEVPPARTAKDAVSNGSESAMLRGFTRDGVVHILGSHTLPNGRFVKIIPE